MLFPRHRSGNARSISERELKIAKRCAGYNSAPVLHPLRLPRLRSVVRKLKIASRGAVPFGRGEIVLIDRI